VKIVQKFAGNITGMGVRYGEEGLPGSRLFDLEVESDGKKSRLYSLLDYSKYTLLLFGNCSKLETTDVMNVLQINTSNTKYANQAILVRPDSYIESVAPVADAASLWKSK
jgi:hypothetical protein